GLHNEGKRIVVIYDEASGIADKVWEVTLGALTDADTEIIWIAFGNPTLNTGEFRQCFGKNRNLWHTAQIDSRTVEGTNKAFLDLLVKTYGEDSDIVKVRVRGMFPSASSMQFIGTDIVEAAQQREVQSLGSDPVIFGVDCARFGDDKSVLAIRCGRDAKSRPWKEWTKQDSMLLAGDIALEAMRWKPDAIFVDAGNIGAAVIDRLRQLEVPNVFEVWFGGEGGMAYLDNGVTVHTGNLRTQMWTKMRAWLKGGAIPENQQLADDLVGPTYAFGADETSIVLEKKKDMKKRGLASPDEGDALACTFAYPVLPRAVPNYLNPENYGQPAGGDRYDELA
ncbi:MAG: terminase, partial [Sphingopyxis sp. 65-8]